MKKSLLNKINELRIKKDMSADREYDGLSFSSSINKKIDMENLLNGDFLFCRPRSVDLDYKRRLIQSSTGGYYTHCAIYIGNGEIIDAASVGRILVSDKIFNTSVIAIHCGNAQNVGFENPTYKTIPSIIL